MFFNYMYKIVPLVLFLLQYTPNSICMEQLIKPLSDTKKAEIKTCAFFALLISTSIAYDDNDDCDFMLSTLHSKKPRTHAILENFLVIQKKSTKISDYVRTIFEAALALMPLISTQSITDEENDIFCKYYAIYFDQDETEMMLLHNKEHLNDYKIKSNFEYKKHKEYAYGETIPKFETISLEELEILITLTKKMISLLDFLLDQQSIINNTNKGKAIYLKNIETVVSEFIDYIKKEIIPINTPDIKSLETLILIEKTIHPILNNDIKTIATMHKYNCTIERACEKCALINNPCIIAKTHTCRMRLANFDAILTKYPYESEQYLKRDIYAKIISDSLSYNEINTLSNFEKYIKTFYKWNNYNYKTSIKNPATYIWGKHLLTQAYLTDIVKSKHFVDIHDEINAYRRIIFNTNEETKDLFLKIYDFIFKNE